MNGADLFSAGFAWDDVANDATPVATPARPTSVADARPVSQSRATPSATLDAPAFSSDFGWSDGSVASVAGVAKDEGRDDVSQNVRAGSATLRATPKSTELSGSQAHFTASVADVASVASWAAGVERMARGYRPAELGEAEWRQLVVDAKQTLQNWGADFIALGWTTLEVFGVNRDPRARRLDIPGLVYLLNGSPIEAIDQDTALIRANPRDTMTFHRRLVVTGGVPVWDWASEARQ